MSMIGQSLWALHAGEQPSQKVVQFLRISASLGRI